MDASTAAGPRLSTAELPARLVSFDASSGKSNLALIGLVHDHVDTRQVSYTISNDVIRRPADRMLA